jgi:hypothetical protein
LNRTPYIINSNKKRGASGIWEGGIVRNRFHGIRRCFAHPKGLGHQINARIGARNNGVVACKNFGATGLGMSRIGMHKSKNNKPK